MGSCARRSTAPVRPSLRGGTRIGRAIAKALSAMPKDRDRDHVMVLLGDGEDHDPDAVREAASAAGKGVKIFTLGLGDAIAGSRIPLTTEAGERAFLEYQGREVVSRLNGSSPSDRQGRGLSACRATNRLRRVSATTTSRPCARKFARHIACVIESNSSGLSVWASFFCWPKSRSPVFRGDSRHVIRFRLELATEPHVCDTSVKETAAEAIMTTMAKCAFSVLLVSVLGFPVVGSAASPSAADLVRGGIDAYKRGDYQAATEAFEEAATSCRTTRESLSTVPPHSLRRTTQKGLRISCEKLPPRRIRALPRWLTTIWRASPRTADSILERILKRPPRKPGGEGWGCRRSDRCLPQLLKLDPEHVDARATTSR